MSKLIVRCEQTVGGNRFVYSVWEPSDLFAHSNIISASSLDPGASGWLGRVGSRPLTPELKALPYGDERVAAVDAFHQAQYEEAYAAIVAEHPEAAGGSRDMGEITVWF